jgi:Bifunctional DNA primase/polymerase, N-terminal
VPGDQKRTGPPATTGEPAEEVPPPRSTSDSLSHGDDRLTAALAYCAAGCSAIPCSVTGKRALVRWAPWQQMAADPEQLRIWWRRWPRANVAIITGRISDLVVVDVDPAHGGLGTLAAMEAEHLLLDRSATVLTPSGGRHYWFRRPGGRLSNSNKAIRDRYGPGVDIRGRGAGAGAAIGSAVRGLPLAGRRPGHHPAHAGLAGRAATGPATRAPLPPGGPGRTNPGPAGRPGAHGAHRGRGQPQQPALLGWPAAGRGRRARRLGQGAGAGRGRRRPTQERGRRHTRIGAQGADS